jgi:hypothetical protein
MTIASNGQRTAHFLQPVQASMSLNTENFFQPCGSSDSKCRWQVGTHQPQPVQQAVSITGLGTGRGDGMANIIGSAESPPLCNDNLLNTHFHTQSPGYATSG